MQSRGCFTNSILFLVCFLVPVVGHIIETLFILEDDYSPAGKFLWLAIVWCLPFLGQFLYLVFGQRPIRRAPVRFGQASSY
jgi:Phospholipase_D-nuclease N-terminal